MAHSITVEESAPATNPRVTAQSLPTVSVAVDSGRETLGPLSLASARLGVAARNSTKRPQPCRGEAQSVAPKRLVGGKFGGIDLGSRLVLLLSAVEFEDAVDVDLGDPMLDGCRQSGRRSESNPWTALEAGAAFETSALHGVTGGQHLRGATSRKHLSAENANWLRGLREWQAQRAPRWQGSPDYICLRCRNGCASTG